MTDKINERLVDEIKNLEKQAKKKKPKNLINLFRDKFYRSPIYLKYEFHWILDRKYWMMYNPNKFIFERTEEEHIMGKIQQWMEHPDIKITPTNRNTVEFYKDAKITTKMEKKQFSFTQYYAFSGGVMDCEHRKVIMSDEFDEISNGAEFLCTLHCNRNYDPTIDQPHFTFLELLKAFRSGMGDYPGLEPVHEPQGQQPLDWEMWVRYLTNMTWLDKSDRLKITLVGLPDAGKSPQIQFVKNMLEGLCAPIKVNQIAEKGELQQAREYPIWYQEDGSMGWAEEKSIQLLKSNFSKNSVIGIRDMYKPTEFEEGGRFIIEALNQTYRFSDKYNTTATWKRFCTLICPNRFEEDEEFEEKILEKEMLDHMFSYFINSEYIKVKQGYDQIEFQERNKLLWNWSAYPIRRVCKMLYKQSFELGSTRESMKVFKDVINELEAQKAQIPSKINKRIKDALAEMGIEFRRNSQTGDMFIGIESLIRRSEKSKKQANKIQKSETHYTGPLDEFDEIEDD